MYTKKFSQQYSDFQYFMEVHAKTLENLAIPKNQHKRFYKAMKIIEFNTELDAIKPDLLPWYTADMAYCKQHIDKKDQYAYFMLLIAVLSEKTESLEWLIDNDIETSFNEEEGETLEYFLTPLIIRAQNLELLQWAVDKELIGIHIKISMTLIFENWFEGFIAYNKRFPQLLFDTPSVPESYLKKIFEVCQSPEGFTCDHFLWQIQTSNIQPKIIFQWLTGNLEFYSPHIVYNHVKYMILCGLRSGNPMVGDWLIQQRFVRPPKVVDQDPVYYWGRHPDTIFPLEGSENRSNIVQAALRELAYSRNTAILEWALKNHLLLDRPTLLDQIIRLDWTEGFEWYAEKFREDLTIPIDGGPFPNPPPAIHLLVILNALNLLKLCIKKWPSLLETRHNGLTIAHSAAACDNFNALRLLQKECPQLMNRQKNQDDLTYLHIAALSGQFDVIPLAKSCNQKLMNAPDNWGSNVAVYALNSGNILLFKQLLKMTDNPEQLHRIRPLDKQSRVSRPYGGKQPNTIQTVLDALNQALDSNFLLHTISFLEPACCQPFENILGEINQKLVRNKITILIRFLAGWMDQQSSLFPLLSELFLHICKSILSPQIPQNTMLCWRNDSFFVKNGQAKDMARDSDLKDAVFDISLALSQ